MQRTADLGVEVRPDAGDGRGKRLVAKRPAPAGSLLFKEAPLVAIQELHTDSTALVCTRCFRMVGSVEAQLASAWRLRQDPPARRGLPDPRSASLPPLPCSDLHPLPPIVSCPSGPACPAAFCSAACRDAAWAATHSALCPCAQDGGSHASSNGDAAMDPLFTEFYGHADATNDVFRLAAKATAAVLLGAARELAARCDGLQPSDATPEQAWAALTAAWEPFSMGQKVLWWDAVARPEDVPPNEEAAFRADMHALAEESLELLTAALVSRLPGHCAAFPAALHPRVWGSLIGMFELNNLHLLVPSPVPAWAQDLDDAVDEGKLGAVAAAAALAAYPVVVDSGGLQGLMEDEDEWACEGNAFYSLQACINHSCAPNAQAWKRVGDDDGDAVILALRDIAAGEEVTIAYIDAEGVDERERGAALADYGFVCGCDRCEADRLADELGLKGSIVMEEAMSVNYGDKQDCL